MTEITIRKSSNIPDGKELFEGISGNFHDFGQTLCELIDNPISNFRAHKIQGLIELTLEEHDTYVDVMIRDNGTGIGDLDTALTIAARSCAQSPLNEHGMGLKHALASIDAGRPSTGASRPGRWRMPLTTATREWKAPMASVCPCILFRAAGTSWAAPARWSASAAPCTSSSP